MEPYMALAKKYSEHSSVGRSALPNAPVQPYRPRRRLCRPVWGWLRRWIGTRPERVPARPVASTLAREPEWCDGSSDTADDRRSGRRQPHDGVECVLPTRSAVR